MNNHAPLHWPEVVEAKVRLPGGGVLYVSVEKLLELDGMD